MTYKYTKKANEEFLLVPRDEIGPTSEAIVNNYNVKQVLWKNHKGSQENTCDVTSLK